MKVKFFKKYLSAKNYAKKKRGKLKPVFEIGIFGGKNFKGYNVIY